MTNISHKWSCLQVTSINSTSLNSFHGEICVFLNHAKVTWYYRHGYNKVNGFYIRLFRLMLYPEVSKQMFKIFNFWNLFVDYRPKMTVLSVHAITRPYVRGSSSKKFNSYFGVNWANNSHTIYLVVHCILSISISTVIHFTCTKEDM